MDEAQPGTPSVGPIPDDAAVEPLDARSVLGLALEAIGPDRLALASSFGAEDMVILDLLAGLTARPRVFTLDTGRLPQETYDLMDAARRRYGVQVEVVFPDRVAVESMVRERGLNFFSRFARGSPHLLRGPQGRAARAGAGRVGRLDHRDPP